jgi:phosphoribulokinase
MLGVVGDSATGKTTLTQGLATLMNIDDAILVCTDDYHKYDRTTRRTLKLSALHPACNYLDIVEQHLNLLQAGQPILKPVYNHRYGTLQAPEYIEPGQFIIVEGLLALATPAMQQCFDITIYLETEESLRRQWKIARDTAERGYTVQEVLASIERRRVDGECYVLPQKKAADLVIKFYRPLGLGEDHNTPLNVQIMQRHTLPNPDLTAILAQFDSKPKPALRLQKDVWTGHYPMDILEIDGDITGDEAQALETLLWDQLEFLDHPRPSNLGSYTVGLAEHHSVPLALTQLLIAYYLLTVRIHQPLSLM